jgi:hypothetical protein
MAGDCYVTAIYAPQGNGIGLTGRKEDAGSWVTYERAVEAARAVAQSLGATVFIHSVDEPAYPKSWAVAS